VTALRNLDVANLRFGIRYIGFLDPNQISLGRWQLKYPIVKNKTVTDFQFISKSHYQIRSQKGGHEQRR
jgi:hypothetical protein